MKIHGSYGSPKENEEKISEKRSKQQKTVENRRKQREKVDKTV